MIANRGEIACRVIRTLKQMGIASVAIYSEADKYALHATMADYAVAIGPAPSSLSYLNTERIINAALENNVDAIHPGYGFLSENAAFVRACDEAGMVFIGPDAKSIEAMGLKDAAKQLMERSGVPIVPGYHGDNQDPAFLARQAREIGYPVLIKARAGGGGKGMRKVESSDGFLEALAGAQREGKSGFNDSRVLIEKYVVAPRHIEMQVFGDRQGNVVHLFERDCSLQRRHQKVIEEAPAPGMTQEMRQAMGDAAVQAARAVNYVGAGTVEFIVDVSDGLRPDRFYFMEMNTRLQVEHPVTECITKIDLVRWQIEIANGNPLPLNQQDINLNGHAFEARIYAEDTDNGFLPATGILELLSLDQTARIDTGVRQGDTISPFYDPMIAKLIVHDVDRNAALSQLTRALGNSRIVGCTTNLGFLRRLSALPQFISGAVETGLIEQNEVLLQSNPEAPDWAMVVAALHYTGMPGFTVKTDPAKNPWRQLTNWRNWDHETFPVTPCYRGRPVNIQLTVTGSTTAVAIINDRKLTVEVQDLSHNRCQLRIDSALYSIDWFYQNFVLDIFAGSDSCQLMFKDPLEVATDSGSDGDLIVAPMPGAIIKISVKAGDQVSPNDSLVVMEAMKMEHTLKAGRAGVIDSVQVSVGDQVDAGTLLISLSPAVESDLL